MKLKLKLHLLLLFLISLLEKNTATATLTKEEFISTVTRNGYSVPKDEVYRYFAEYSDSFSREEVAMFIAQLIHESGGFKHKEQLGCTKGDHCRGNYVDGVGLPDKNYHGRGYIQLTWGANYKLASEGLGLGDRLLKNPDLIANDTKLSMLVSVWYWEVRVRPLLKDKEDWFGLTTKGINPAECRIPAIARLRYGIYLRVAEALEISSKAKENGCYN